MLTKTYQPKRSGYTKKAFQPNAGLTLNTRNVMYEPKKTFAQNSEDMPSKAKIVKKYERKQRQSADESHEYSTTQSSCSDTESPQEKKVTVLNSEKVEDHSCCLHDKLMSQIAYKKLDF